MPDTSKLEKLNRELEKSEKKLRKAINDEKALQHQLKQLTRKERTHRLCTRGGMLESFLQEPERLTDDDVMLLLKLIFHRQDTQELLKKMLEREKPEIVDKGELVDWRLLPAAEKSAREPLPALAGALTAFECRVDHLDPAGDHMLVIGYVDRAWSRAGSDDRGRIDATDALLCVQHDLFTSAKLG